MSARIAIRADAGPTIGGGHVMRCRALAAALICENASVALFSKPAGNIAESMLWGKVTHRLVGKSIDDSVSAITEFFGEPADSLIVNSYAIGRNDETCLRAAAHNLIALSDSPNQPHDCDVLIDPTLGRTRAEYRDLVPPGVLILTGAEFVLLAQEFSIMRRKLRSQPQHVMISFGLTDPDQIALRTTRAVISRFPDLRISVVIGPDASSRAGLESMGSRLSLHIAASNMAEILSEVDLAIGAGGISAWERCYMGIPSVIAAIAENQRPNLVAMSTAGVALVAEATVGQETTIVDALGRLLNDPQLRAEMSTRAMALVDGHGAARVAKAILSLPQLRPATSDDMRDVWTWRNDPSTRQNSLDTEEIAWPDHQRWFTATLVNPNRVLYVAQSGPDKIGSLRFDRQPEQGDTWKVSIAIAPERRGRGYGGPILATGCRLIGLQKGAKTVIAEVKQGNQASMNLFHATGFREARPAAADIAFLRRAL